MPRLFVAIEFPQEARDALSGLCLGLPDARWVHPGNFHLTLRFIGEAEDAATAGIIVALRHVAAPRFRLTLAGVGHFGRHTLWAGVVENPALAGLQGAIENELEAIGLAVDPRPFRPHVKLARLRRRRGLRAYLAEHTNFRAAPFDVAEFALVESRLNKDGPVYSRKEGYPLLDEAEFARLREPVKVLG